MPWQLPETVPPTALWRLTFGATPLADGVVRFRVWAPRQATLAVELGDGRRVPLRADGEGVHEALVEQVPPGTDYRYLLEDGRALPDPVSRWQPEGVHGPSRVVDPAAFPWSDDGWRGLPLETYVAYELHVGTFTPAGTFEGVIDRLQYLRALGVTAVELMPVAAFPGERNWGYDGVHLYAPQHSYGGPEGLKRLVDACHAHGLAVVLDVVYNHLGPEGNYLGAYGPYFSGRYRTPWGEAVNYDGSGCHGVRRHVIENALYWLTEYHIDALRLDAVHGIFDFGARHVLEELGAAFHRQAGRLGRQAWVIAESDLNDVRVIDPPALGGWGLDAQWSDDFHHALHTAVSGAHTGYFADFGRLDDVRKALECGFVYDGRFSHYRGRPHGNSAAQRPGRQFMIAAQNHDQVANASQGARHGTLLSPAQQMLAAALLLCAPNLPLLFMGQEYGEKAPFHYFTSHGDPALAEAVSRGRREEFAAFGRAEAFADPQDARTFERSRLDWALHVREPHAGLLRFYEALLILRRERVCLHNFRKDLARARCDELGRWLTLERNDPGGEAAVLCCNFSPEPNRIPLPEQGEAWQLALWSGEPRFGDPPEGPAPPASLATPGDEPAALNLPGWHVALYLRR